MSISGCKKFVEVPAPITSTNAANVYTSDLTAAAVLTGIYTNISFQDGNSYADITSLSSFAALSADELTLYEQTNTTYLPFYINNITSLTSTGVFWTIFYPYIFIANSAIEGLNNSTGLTPAVKQQLLGEARFVRAFCYFYLVNLYGDIPLVVSSNYKKNSLLIRTPASLVYQQIITDLIDAKNLLSTNYLQSDALTPYPISSAQRVRPTKWAAAALLARAYLFIGDYPDAESMADSVIMNGSLYSLGRLNTAFLENSSETIWSLQPTGTGAQSNTGDGALFVLPSTGPGGMHTVYLSNSVVNSFELNDQRRTNWVDSVIAGGITYYYAYKYKIGAVDATTQEYIMVLRLAEQYLIRAEARAQQNKIGGAQADLDTIRARAGLSITEANEKTSLLTAILHERQVELFTEWGHRWIDLKRTNKINEIMTIVTPTKGGSWSSFKSLYPVPQSEINFDPNLKQNNGYP